MRKTVMLVLLVLLAVLAMPIASAQVTVHFDPQDSIVPGGYCNTTYVKLMLNISEPNGVNFGDIFVNTNATCVDVTNVVWNTTLINTGASAWHNESTPNPCGDVGYDYMLYTFYSAQHGDVEICTMTIHCNCSTCGCCTSPLNFTCGAMGCMQCPITMASGGIDLYPNNVTLENGTVTCGTGPAEVDLNVTNIYFNPGDTRANETLRVYVNQSNDICAVVHNNGPDDVLGDFDVCFEVDGNKTDCVTVTGGLAAGADKVVCSTWTPTCENYSVMPGYPLQSLPFTINVTADCNCASGCCPNCPNSGSCGKINEADEANNTLSMYVPALQDPIKESTGLPYGFDVIGGVVNNGYKSKHFDCNTSEDPFDYKVVYRNLIGGGLVYNVTGAELTLGQGNTTTRVHTITIPDGVAVKKAMLFVYWRDAWGTYKTYPSGCLANLSANMSSGGVCATSPAVMPIEATYHDSKGFGLYQAPIGVHIYNVTDWVCTNSGSPVDYTVNVKNIEPTGGNKTKPMGQKLVVVYEGDGTDLTHIWIQEGADLLMAADATHGTYAYHVSPAEATATIPFDGTDTIPSNISSATLTAVAVYGLNHGSDLLFNGNVLVNNAWLTDSPPGSKVCIEEEPLNIGTDFIVGSTNSMGFMDINSDGFYAHNTFLVVKERGDVLVEIDPCPVLLCANSSDPACRVTVNISLSGITDYGSGTIELCCDPTVAMIESIGPGDSDGFTHSPLGGACVTISAHSMAGLCGDGVRFATATFKPIGAPGTHTCLNLTVNTLYDRNGTALPTVVVDCCPHPSALHIIEHDPPWIVAPVAHPPVILNDTHCQPNCPLCLAPRPRVQNTNITNLTVHVTDATSVEYVTVDLTPIGLGIVNMTGPNGSTSGDWYYVTNASYSRPGNPYCLDVIAADLHGNKNTGSCIPLEVRRRGDIDLNNNVDSGDYAIIAQYTVGLRPVPDEFLAGTVPADSWNGIDMADALPIIMYEMLNPCPPFQGYPAP